MSDLIDRGDVLGVITCFFKDNYIEDADWHLSDLEREINRLDAASPWHRVEEPPKVGQNVLTMDANEDMETATYGGKDFEDAYGFYVEDVLYWMPLPEPPKEDA